ncbi:MAG: PadR family transcriptional regulator [Candidatus Hodarchaeales archaeon]|jgi:DNA-binding PadR family transcriptional regulator
MIVDDLILKWIIEYKKGFAKPLILRVLAHKSNYPYQITKEVLNMTNGQLNIATSNIYPILKNLKESGMILEHREEQSRRIMYSLSDQGVTVLNQIQPSMEAFLTDLLGMLKVKGVEITI